MYRETGTETVTRISLIRRVGVYLGPAFVVAVAYVDPGNLATNVSAGAEFGYRLLWVIVTANLMAILVQFMSAKLGLATGKDLAEHCRDRYPRPVVIGLWLQAEIMVIMTELAEVVGGALAFQLLFGVSLLEGAGLTVAAMMVIVAFGRGRRRLQGAVAVLLGVVLAGFVFGTAQAGVDVGSAAQGLLPSIPDERAALLAVGIVGATVMPHAIYLHSALTRDIHVSGSSALARQRATRSTLTDVLLALSLAGCVNIAILFGGTALAGQSIESLTQAYHAFGATLGTDVALAFVIALLASGLAATTVGVYSGQVVMQGFLRRSVPVWVRRTVSLVPTFVVLAAGVEPTSALVFSQVVLSFAIPMALVPLVRLTGDRTVMGDLVNGPWLQRAAIVVAVAILALNTYLLIIFFG